MGSGKFIIVIGNGVGAHVVSEARDEGGGRHVVVYDAREEPLLAPQVAPRAAARREKRLLHEEGAPFAIREHPNSVRPLHIAPQEGD